MKWPLWVRIIAAPFRFIIFIVATFVSIAMFLAGEADLAGDMMDFIVDYGNK